MEFCLLLLAACSQGPTSTVAISPAGHFEFQVGPWLALHHFAYHYVREELPNPDRRGRVPILEADKQAYLANMSVACAPLIGAYSPYIEGDIRSDEQTRGIAEALIVGVQTVEDTAVKDALTNCMPAYLEALWPKHHAASTSLVHRLMNQLAIHEHDIANHMVSTLEGSWPTDPIRVDITPYANWAGAYTDDTPANITMSSYDEDVSGPLAFEILMHESSHTVSFENSIRSKADEALAEVGMENDRFWHYVLFFATGRITTEVLDDPTNIPFAESTGLKQSESAAPFYQALEDTWDLHDGLYERVLGAACAVAREDDIQR